MNAYISTPETPKTVDFHPQMRANVAQMQPGAHSMRCKSRPSAPKNRPAAIKNMACFPKKPYSKTTKQTSPPLPALSLNIDSLSRIFYHQQSRLSTTHVDYANGHLFNTGTPASRAG